MARLDETRDETRDATRVEPVFPLVSPAVAALADYASPAMTLSSSRC
ncbi:MAG: hypothetical protein HQL49_05525 [Gammaproteobacteria bacterium]|nr:hypothetical protein [Gammaproteobacteria bacterium]